MHMSKSPFRRRVARVAAGMAVASLALGASVITGPSAGADPKQFSALVGFGSDTTQDILNALSGEANGNLFNAVRSDAASGKVQITSWDAVGSTCITPKAPGATINRPNGSSAGRRILSRAIEGTTYGNASCGASATGKPVAGLVDFARSSAGPSGSGSALTYIPLGRDALSFGFYRAGGSPVTTLTRADLTAIFTNTGAPLVIGGVEIIPCGIQTASGTFQSWNTLTTASTGQEATATATCNAAGNGARLQENDATGLKAKGDAIAGGKQVIVGFSAANFISQSNGVAASQMAVGVDLGSISNNGTGTNIGVPYTGTAPNLVPAATFYNDSVFGRTVYNVLDSDRVNGFGDNALKTMFVGPTSAICSAAAQTTVNAFGFLTVTDCGSTTLTGPLVSGTL